MKKMGEKIKQLKKDGEGRKDVGRNKKASIGKNKDLDIKNIVFSLFFSLSFFLSLSLSSVFVKLNRNIHLYA